VLIGVAALAAATAATPPARWAPPPGWCATAAAIATSLPARSDRAAYSALAPLLVARAVLIGVAALAAATAATPPARWAPPPGWCATAAAIATSLPARSDRAAYSALVRLLVIRAAIVSVAALAAATAAATAPAGPAPGRAASGTPAPRSDLRRVLGDVLREVLVICGVVELLLLALPFHLVFVVGNIVRSSVVGGLVHEGSDLAIRVTTAVERLADIDEILTSSIHAARLGERIAAAHGSCGLLVPFVIRGPCAPHICHSAARTSCLGRPVSGVDIADALRELVLDEVEGAEHALARASV